MLLCIFDIFCQRCKVIAATGSLSVEIVFLRNMVGCSIAQKNRGSWRLRTIWCWDLAFNFVLGTNQYNLMHCRGWQYNTIKRPLSGAIPPSPKCSQARHCRLSITDPIHTQSMQITYTHLIYVRNWKSTTYTKTCRKQVSLKYNLNIFLKSKGNIIEKKIL